MPRLFYGSVQVNGLRINYYRTGDEKPPVVMLHGLADSALTWNRLPVALEPEFDVILVDLRGHGFSGAPDSGYRLQDFADDVVGLIGQLGIERPALVGHGLGAAVAAQIAAQNPLLVRGLVLIEPPWPQPGANAAERAEQALGWAEQIAADRALSIDELIEQCRARFPAWDASEAFQWAKARRMVRPEAAQVLADDWPDWREVLPQIETPGVLIHGDPALGSQLGPEVLLGAPILWLGGELVPLPNTGHYPHREAYREVYRLAQRYLRRWMSYRL
jgi:pimeloyl-ACP methyl ester carboxylesterase